MKWPTAPNAADATANTLSTKAAEAYSIFWICSLSSGLDPNKINGLSKKNRSKMPVCPPNCPPLAYGFYEILVVSNGKTVPFYAAVRAKT
jgi:hypothetical protein